MYNVARLFIFRVKNMFLLGINFFGTACVNSLCKTVYSIYFILCLPKIKTSENLMNIVCDQCDVCLLCVLLVIENRGQTSFWKTDQSLYKFTEKQ